LKENKIKYKSSCCNFLKFGLALEVFFFLMYRNIKKKTNEDYFIISFRFLSGSIPN